MSAVIRRGWARHRIWRSSIEARGDTAVVDEPFYAAYLQRTGLDHPMREEVIASQSIDPNEIEKMLVGPVPGDAAVWYQKLMTPHLQASVDEAQSHYEALRSHRLSAG